MNRPAANEKRLAIVGIAAAALVLGIAGFVLYRVASVAWAIPPTASKIPPMVAVKALEGVGKAFPIDEKTSPDVDVYSTPMMPIYGVELARDQRLQWQAVVMRKGTAAGVIIEIQALGKEANDWHRLRTSTLTLADGTRRLDLKAESANDPKRTDGSVMILSDGDLSALSLLARAKNPRLIFGATIGEIGPDGVATCKELIRKAVRAQEKARGTSAGLTEKIVSMNAGDGDKD